MTNGPASGWAISCVSGHGFVDRGHVLLDRNSVLAAKRNVSAITSAWRSRATPGCPPAVEHPLRVPDHLAAVAGEALSGECWRGEAALAQPERPLAGQENPVAEALPHLSPEQPRLAEACSMADQHVLDVGRVASSTAGRGPARAPTTSP